jgi:hypothetical protein
MEWQPIETAPTDGWRCECGWWMGRDTIPAVPAVERIAEWGFKDRSRYEWKREPPVGDVEPEQLDEACHCGKYPEGKQVWMTRCPIIEHRARSGAQWRADYLEIEADNRRLRDQLAAVGEIERLIAQWRAEADAEDARLKQYCYGGELDGDMLDEDIGNGFVRTAERRKCADELEAALAGRGRPRPPQEPKSGSV